MKDIFFSLFKIILFIFFLPLLVAACISFQSSILALTPSYEAWVLWGGVGFILTYIFIYDFKHVFMAGRTVTEKIFSFYPPLAQVACYVVPFYAVVLILIYGGFLLTQHGVKVLPYFIFMIAFAMVLHLVLTARELYDADKSVLKAHYFLIFGIVLVFSFIMIALLLSCVIPDYSLTGFIKSLTYQVPHMYKDIYKLLFVDPSV